MSEGLIALCGLLYSVSAIDLFLRDQPGLSLTFAAYAIANIGLLWAAYAGR